MSGDCFEEWLRKPIPICREELIYPIAHENGEKLVDITDEERIVYSAYYRKEMGLRTGLERCYVRETPARLLKTVLALLPRDYSLLVYDSLRTVQVQQELYDLYSRQIRRDHPQLDEQEILALVDDFVAFPRIDRERPTPHSTGGALDLTLLKNGRAIEMGTGFDDLTEKAHTDYFEVLERKQELTEEQKEALKNRRILYHAMLQAGFVNYRGEWWHYSYGDRAWGAQTGNTVLYSYVDKM